MRNLMKMAFCMAVIIALILFCFGYMISAFSFLFIILVTYLLAYFTQ